MHPPMPRRRIDCATGSKCPACGAAIRFYDNIPLVSYLILRGRCRKCGQAISIRYAADRTAHGLLFSVLFMLFGLSVELASGPHIRPPSSSSYLHRPRVPHHPRCLEPRGTRSRPILSFVRARTFFGQDFDSLRLPFGLSPTPFSACSSGEASSTPLPSSMRS